MDSVKLKVVGCGDAFGSGGLHATCFYVETPNLNCLIDIGAGGIAGLKMLDIDPVEIDLIILTHFHGDHYGGLPNFLLDAIFIQARKKELRILGPPGVERRVWQLQEAMYGGTSTMDFQFPISFQEYTDRGDISLSKHMTVRAIPVVHSEPSNPHAVRVNIDGRSIVYTGDTEWTEHLVSLTQGCDLLISECFGWNGPMKYHLSYDEIIDQAERLNAKRIVLTHLGPEALARQDEMNLTVLEPGMEILL